MQRCLNFTHKSLLPNETQLNDIWYSFLNSNSPKTFQGGIKEKIFSILSLSFSRHGADWNDPDVRFINSLELDYLVNNKSLLNKVRTITIEKDIIRIAGFELSRFDLLNQNIDIIGVNNISNNSGYYDYLSAMKLLNSNGFNLITKEQLQLILDAIPCENEIYLPHFLINILNFSRGGFKNNTSGNLIDKNSGHYWLFDRENNSGFLSSFSIYASYIFMDGKHSPLNSLFVRGIKQKSFLN